nr:hypothetical protein [Tanacetum cinerariifolium]
TVYSGVDFCKKQCGVSIVRRSMRLNLLLHPLLVVNIAWRYLSGRPPLSDISVLAAIYRSLGGYPKYKRIYLK